MDQRGPIELTGALELIDEYLARLKPKYESGETALAETTFGFSRAPNDFIEICVHTPLNISFTVELPPSPTGGLLAKLRGSFRREQILGSPDSLGQHVTAYFNLVPEQFKARVQADA